MEKREVVRAYNFADGTLITVCNEKQSFAVRDQAEMTTMGIDAPYLLAFVTEINSFETLPTDEELEGEQIIATENKDADADKVREAVRGIMTRVENKWGVQSGRYRKYETKGLSQMSDSQILVCGRRVVRVATANLVELASEGLTAGIIADLDTKCQSFEDTINIQKNAIADRDIAVEDRIEAGNGLFAKNRRICNAGQNIWHEVDEAKFNDYITYNTPSGEPPMPIAGPILHGETKNLKRMTFQPQDIIQATAGATELKLCIAPNGTTACANGGLLAAGESKNFFASELGDVENNRYLNITNPDAVNDGSYSVVIVEA